MLTDLPLFRDYPLQRNKLNGKPTQTKVREERNLVYICEMWLAVVELVGALTSQGRRKTSELPLS